MKLKAPAFAQISRAFYIRFGDGNAPGMDNLQLLYKYLAHVHHLEESTFLELVNTPFSPIRFTNEECELLREMEMSILLGHPQFTHENHQ